jgi:hypothetical protein
MSHDEVQVNDIVVQVMHGGFWTKAHITCYEPKDTIRHFCFL